MSFKDFLKNNGAETQMEMVASEVECIGKEITPAILEETEQPDQLQELRENLSVLLAATQKQGKNGQECKILLTEMTQKGNEFANLHREQNEKMQQIEKRLAAADKSNEQIQKAIIGLLVLAYVTFCTCAAIAQQLFNVNGIYGIWSFFKIFTGLKLLI